MFEFRRILVATDFSKHAEYAVRYATELAHKVGASLRVLHVMEEDLLSLLPAISKYVKTEEFDLGHYRDEIQRGAKLALDAEVATCRERGVEASPWLLHSGKSFAEILRAAREWPADLLVLATHGRTGIAHALIGSTAERVVRKASCPVLTVKPQDQE